LLAYFRQVTHASGRSCKREENVLHRGVVLPALAVGIRQAGEAAVVHSHREIESFDMAGANPVRVRIAEAATLFRRRDSSKLIDGI
jgi:hypothetical protein